MPRRTPSVPEDFADKEVTGTGSLVNSNLRLYSSVGDLRPGHYGQDPLIPLPPPAKRLRLLWPGPTPGGPSRACVALRSFRWLDFSSVAPFPVPRSLMPFVRFADLPLFRKDFVCFLQVKGGERAGEKRRCE